LLWRDGIEPVGGWGAYGSGNFWHSVAQLTFDVGGPKVRHGSFHARPFGRQSRADEAERLAHVVNRPASRPAGLIGGDWNCLSADWIADDGSVPRHDGTEPQQQMRYYDPDPWTEQPWHGDFAFQCDWGYEPSGRRWHRADRRPADILYASGLADAAAALAAPWENTCGHWNSGADPLGARRLDRILVTHEVRPALVRYEVVRTELAKSASDHLPVIVEYDPDLLGD
jgi:endonuclease/exonuclease/phosphatase family metal-dependent hydrolase